MLPAYNKVVCDVPLTGIGAVLLQEGGPVAYESKKLSSAERNYTTGEQELFAVVHAMRTWRCYLEGVDSTMVTDHNPLVFLQTQANLSRRQFSWSEYLQAFRFRWQDRVGRIKVADPLSRVQAVTVAAVTRGKRKCAEPDLPAANPSADPSSVLPSDPGTVLPQNPNLTTEQQSLTDFQLQVQQGYEQDTGLSPAHQAKCREKQGFWWYGYALVIPDSQILRKQCLHELHNCPYSCHPGIIRLRRPWKGCTGGKACVKTCVSISETAQNVRKTRQTAIRNQVVCFSRC